MSICATSGQARAKLKTPSRKYRRRCSRAQYSDVFTGPEAWQAIKVEAGASYAWENSTYIKQPPFFSVGGDLDQAIEVSGARILALLGDSVTTDHISPAGAIQPASPAGEYLQQYGVDTFDFNSYGSRRGNHEVMMRGTFANIRINNEMTPEREGGYTRHIPTGDQLAIYDAAMRYQGSDTPLVVFAGKEYGTGSSRDWAAKGTRLLGVKAVVAESFERIHRSNLIGMGVLPLEFLGGETRRTLKLTGDETVDIELPDGVTDAKPRQDHPAAHHPGRWLEHRNHGALPDRHRKRDRVLQERRDSPVCAQQSTRRRLKAWRTHRRPLYSTWTGSCSTPSGRRCRDSCTPAASTV